MINVNVILDGLLNKLDGVKVVAYYPRELNELPVVSYYEITSPTGFCADNAEWAQRSYVAIDVWARSIYDSGEIAIKVDEIMQADGWYRETSRDMPPEDGAYRKNMRFYKQIFFERND